MTDLIPAEAPRPVRPLRRRAVLHVASERIAELLRLPDGVTIVGFQLDHIRDSVSLLLEGDQFEPVQPGCEPASLLAELSVETGEEGSVTMRTTWPSLDGAELTVRREARRAVAREYGG